MVESVKDRPAGRAETRRAQRRELIIAAAEQELEASGLSGITLRAVGDRVGLSKGALYYYVDSRDSLLALVLEDALEAIRAEADASVGPDADPLERLLAFGRAHVRRSVDRPAGPLIASSVYELASHDGTAALLRAHTDAFQRIVDDAVAAGQLQPVPPLVGAAAFFGTLNSLAGTFEPGGPLDLDDVVDAAFDLLVAGWRTNRGDNR